MKLLTFLNQLNESTEKRNEHLTAEEQYHRYGNIKGKVCEELLDIKEKFNAFKDSFFTEVLTSLPDEDFLDENIEDLKDIIGGMNKSVHKEKLIAFLKQLEQKQLEVVQSADYGADIINKFKRKLGL